MQTLDLDAVQTFALLASLLNFTRVAEATGTTQSAVSLKLKRLEASLGRRLVERTPRSVRLTAEGEAFLEHARALLEANERALSGAPGSAARLRIGISDHVLGSELPMLLARLSQADPSLALDLSIGFSQQLIEAHDQGRFDGVIVRQERSSRDGETLAEDELSWFAAASFHKRAGEPLPLANLASPCGIRAIAVRALEAAGQPWREAFVGGGVSAVSAAVSAGLAVGAFARRVAPPGCIDVAAKLSLPPLPRTKVVLYSRVSEPRAVEAFRVLAAGFRSAAGR
ncbi:LysR substrate-binding domain-containing protein [Chelativorans sp.]|uniref:LysR substrate-binding domain-containing protein n=1 Tax=Chelativorans sp. TaxID=2203393 RepID=UPI002812707C|nr:LysR substrate-binding domain-containing protein [Chelativorans sp.]